MVHINSINKATIIALRPWGTIISRGVDYTEDNPFVGALPTKDNLLDTISMRARRSHYYKCIVLADKYYYVGLKTKQWEWKEYSYYSTVISPLADRETWLKEPHERLAAISGGQCKYYNSTNVNNIIAEYNKSKSKVISKIIPLTKRQDGLWDFTGVIYIAASIYALARPTYTPIIASIATDKLFFPNI